MRPLVVLSGATGGIGSVVAHILWHAHYSLLLLGRDEARLHELFTDIKTQGFPPEQVIYTASVDFRSEEDWWRVTSVLKQHAKDVYGLVTCHGAPPQPMPMLHERARQTTQDMYTVDVMGTFRLCQMVGSYLVDNQRGSMVLLSSIHARATYPERVPYLIAKAGVVSLARGLAVEWGKYGVRVNSLLPWQTTGPRTDKVALDEFIATSENTLELYRQRSPLRAFITPDAIADAVVFLLETPGMTGQELVLDAGVTASMWHKPFLSEDQQR